MQSFLEIVQALTSFQFNALLEKVQEHQYTTSFFPFFPKKSLKNKKTL